jgi:alkylation response protein AidB-like acyl-CoA dehydrogenase
MDFALNEEQLMFRDLFRDFARKEVLPRAEQTDKREALSPEVIQKAAAQGFLGAAIPEEYGGAGLDYLSACLLMEELGRACLSTAITVGIQNALVGLTILEAGDDAQKKAVLPRLAAGEAISSFAQTEPDAGSDVSSIQTTARHDGDDYILNGVKSWVSNAGVAGIFLVSAQLVPDNGRGGGLTQFIVERDTPGFTIGYREPTMGVRGLTIHTVHLENCRVPPAQRLGEEGEGWRVAAGALNRMRLALSAAALGLAQGALDLGRKYAVERAQFGAPIATKQAVGNYFADSATEIEALRSLAYRGAWLYDRGEDYHGVAAMAKLFGGQVARSTANRMLQIHGGYGFSDEYAISRVYRDARALDFLGGTPQIQRVVIAQDLFKDLGVEVKP